MESDRRRVSTQGPGPVRVVRVRGRRRGQLAHSLDPRYQAVKPADIEAAATRLARLIDPAGVDRVLGLPEGGVMLAYAVARRLDRPFVSSTLMPHEFGQPIVFEEPHNVGAERNHYVYALEPGQRVLIVEDEVSTGRTVINAVRALRAAGIHVEDVLALFGSDDPRLWERIAAENVRLQVDSRVSDEVTTDLLGDQAE